MSLFKIRQFFRFYLLAFVTALFFLVFTFLAFWEVHERVSQRNENLFQSRVGRASTAIEKRMEDYMQILKGAQGLFQVMDTISRADWQNYVSTIEVEENYPGIQGLGYAPFLSGKEIDSFEVAVRQREYPYFQVWPKEKKSRDLYSTILFLEPLDARNLRALGYDMFSDSIRRVAMERARDTGRPAMSGMVKLVQETKTKVQKGFLLYLPVYEKNSRPESVEERREAIKGFVYSPFRVEDLMRGILGPGIKDLDIEIYEGITIGEDELLFDSNSSRSDQQSLEGPLQELRSLQIGGHIWNIHFAAQPDFGNEVSFPWFILAGGIIISSLMFIIMYSVANVRQSMYLNEVITDNATAALLILDVNDYCTFMNPAAEILTGYSLEEIQSSTLHNQIHNCKPDGSLYPAEECPIIKTLSSRSSLSSHEDVFFRKDGQSIQVSINARPIHEKGVVVAYLMEVRDITRQKEAEAGLKQKNRNLKTLNHIGQNLSAELELEKLLQVVTDSATTLTGAEFGAFFYHRQEDQVGEGSLFTVSGMAQELFDQFPLPRQTQVFGKTNPGSGLIRSNDIRKDPRFNVVIPPDESGNKALRIVSYLSVPVISRSGAVIGGLFFGHSQEGIFDENAEAMVKGIASQAAVAIDNSRLFETINAQNKELIRTNNDLDNFVYTASHDLKAPMLNIEGLVNALKKALQTERTGQVEQIIELISLSVIKFKETIGALTEVSKINKNLDEELEVVRLDEMLEDIQFSIQDTIKASGTLIMTDLGCNELYFSRANMRSILSNLLTNSIKYRSPDRAPLIRLSCRKEGGNFILQISDNGMGIPEKQLDKVFMMFKRYHSHVDGTGVGLYLVKRIVENYGGSIKVESQVEEGTTFTLILPELELKEA